MLPDLLSLVFPPSCPACRVAPAQLHPDTRLCQPCHDAFILAVESRRCMRCARLLPPAGSCISCNNHGIRPISRVVSAAPFCPPFDALLHHYKFHHRFQLAPMLALTLADALQEHLASLKPDIIIPVRLHWRRRLIRGYDQAALLAHHLAKHLGLPSSTALYRTRPTLPQTAQMSRRHRAANMNGAFTLSKRAAAKLAGQRILLVDDVMTTGSTLRAASRALLAAGLPTPSAAVVATAIPPGLKTPAITEFDPAIDP